MDGKVRSVGEFLKHAKDGEVIDYNNPDCKSCNDCCGSLTYLTLDEYAELQVYFAKNKIGKIIYKKAIDRVLKNTKELDALYLKCPLTNGIMKCEIYKKRPSICRDFHCKAKLSKVTDENKDKYFGKTIFDLFKDDLMKDKKFREKFLMLLQNIE